MKNRIISYAQTGFEGARWLRNEAEVGGTFTSHIQNRSFREAGLLAVRNGLLLLPTFDVRNSLRGLVDDKIDVIGVGSEVIVTRSGSGGVHKYLTGKVEKPDTLAPRLQALGDKAKKYLGDYLLETVVTSEKVKLFKGLRASEYARLDQPFVDIKLIDPHRDSEILKSRPEIADAIRDFSTRLVDLFEGEGLLMDIVNDGNLVWGSIGDDKEQLYLLDTIPVDYGKSDFTGINVPFWSPEMHLEYLADFVNTAHSNDYFTEESVADWL